MIVHVHWMAPAECAYTLDGVNLTELRRTRLRTVARSLGVEVSVQATKQELLLRIVGVLDQLGAPKDIAAVKRDNRVRIFGAVAVQEQQ